MLTEADLATYVERVRYQWIDVDRVFGAQCWDQWSHYGTNFLGVPSWPTYTNAGGTHPHGGYACNVYHNARAAGLEQWFEILPASATPRPGDVAFWEYGSAWYPWSHVATVLAVTHGGRMLRCLTQNPGAVQVADLIVSGVIGYLRPRALAVGNVNTDRTPNLTHSEKQARRKKKRMFVVRYKNGNPKGGTGWIIIGTPKPEIITTIEAARAVLDQLGIANSYEEPSPIGWVKWLRMAGMTAEQIAKLDVK